MTQQCDTLIITDVGMFHIVCTISLWINMIQEENTYWFKVSGIAIYHKHKSNMSYDFFKCSHMTIYIRNKNYEFF